MKSEKKKPARDQVPNDYLSPSRSKPKQLTGWLKCLGTRTKPMARAWCEKGRAGGRARHPARPLAGSRSLSLKRLSPMGWILKSLSFRWRLSPTVCCFSLGLNLRYCGKQNECQYHWNGRKKRSEWVWLCRRATQMGCAIEDYVVRQRNDKDRVCQFPKAKLQPSPVHFLCTQAQDDCIAS